MLEISIRHDDNELQFLRVPDGVDIDAVVNLIRATLENHRSAPTEFGQPNTEIRRSNVHRVRKPSIQPNGEPTMTNNARVVLSAVVEYGHPVAEARVLLDIAKLDPRFRGDSVETVRRYLRDFETVGWLKKNLDGKRELTPLGREAAAKYGKKNSQVKLNELEDISDDDLPFPPSNSTTN